jgi:hypothetical protein
MLNLVKMFARRISATERLVRSPPAFVSPRERRSATWPLLNPAGGVHAIGAAGAGGVEAAASAMPDHSISDALNRAVEGQERPGPQRRKSLRPAGSAIIAKVSDHASRHTDRSGESGHAPSARALPVDPARTPTSQWT